MISPGLFYIDGLQQTSDRLLAKPFHYACSAGKQSADMKLFAMPIPLLECRNGNLSSHDCKSTQRIFQQKSKMAACFGWLQPANEFMEYGTCCD